jgi:HlyD family secretion protein
MKRIIFWTIVVAAAAGVGAAGYGKFHTANNGGGNDKYRTAAVRRGSIKLVVTSTGTVQPVQSVQVGTYASGPILKVNVDFNDKVQKGQILAEIDPQIYKAQRQQAKAALDNAQANLVQVQAKCKQTEQDFKRAKELHKIEVVGMDHPIKGIADSDFDLAEANCDMAEANVDVARATVEQCKAALDMAETNLGYTVIHSPVDGVVTDRKVDPGQTVAAQFQTPVMFVVAPDLEKKIYIYASVDEADIGMVREAQERGEPVVFSVDAYPKDKFEGKIFQVRLNPTTVQNVVTYTVVVESPNPQIKLLPGMTANLSFQIEKHTSVLTLPNAALRFYPKPEQVRPSDRAILDGKAFGDPTKRDAASVAENSDGDDGLAAPVNRNRKYVWLPDGDLLLRGVEVEIGLSDKTSTEIVSGDLQAGQEVVVGLQTLAAKATP